MPAGIDEHEGATHEWKIGNRRMPVIINGKIAKTLGLKIPQSLLISADKVIE